MEESAELKEIKECRKDTQSCLEATKELTKIVSDLVKEMEKLRKAGRF